VALERIICKAKKGFKNVFTPEQILKKMDLNGGTLKYEGIAILNDVEAASYNGNKSQYRN
jgi:hypothetical protein